VRVDIESKVKELKSEEIEIFIDGDGKTQGWQNVLETLTLDWK